MSDAVRALLVRRQSGWNLEAPFYTSPEIFKLDLELVFGRHWIYVGIEPDVPRAGDYFAVDIGPHSVIVIRDDDLQIRAFHNVCRHRGARLCTESKGDIGVFVCPYHQWTYDLSGNLVHAAHMGEGFDRSQFGLKPVHIRSLQGLLFVCLAAEPPADFEQMRASMEPYIAPHRLQDCKIAHAEDLIEEGNWKLTMENNRECYHCSANHAELTQSLYEFGYGFQPTEGNREQLQEYGARVESEHRRWENLGLPSTEIDCLGTTTGFRTMRVPLNGKGESQTLDTGVASRRLLGEFKQRDLGGLTFWAQPNSWHHFMSDHIVTFSVLPLSAQRTLLRTKWLVHKDAQEGIDYQLSNLTAVWRATNEQDAGLVALAQKGIGSSAYEPGPYSPHTETLVEKFTDWYVRALER